MSARELKTLLNNYRLPTPLGFGQELAPVMYRADYCAGHWQQGTLQAFGEIGINPAATAVQFAQQAFEGMKAYQINQATPALFRPEINFHRLNRSANRLCMPVVPVELFAQALTSASSQPAIPACHPRINFEFSNVAPFSVLDGKSRAVNDHGETTTVIRVPIHRFAGTKN